jgi:hypothetical protein
MLEKLIELEEKLKHHSHDQTAIKIVQEFAASLGKTRNKQVLFGTDGVLLREPPIIYQEVVEKGLISQDEDPFSLLQGDTTDIIANLVLLDGVVQIRLSDLHLATRHASLGLTGWRIFGALLKTVMARTGESEVKIRS